MTEMIWQAIAVFLAYVVLDVIWAKYTIALAARDKLWAPIWSMLIPALAGYATIQFVEEPWLLIPVALGSFVGTRLALEDGKLPDRQEHKPTSKGDSDG